MSDNVRSFKAYHCYYSSHVHVVVGLTISIWSCLAIYLTLSMTSPLKMWSCSTKLAHILKWESKMATDRPFQALLWWVMYVRPIQMDVLVTWHVNSFVIPGMCCPKELKNKTILSLKQYWICCYVVLSNVIYFYYSDWAKFRDSSRSAVINHLSSLTWPDHYFLQDVITSSISTHKKRVWYYSYC